RSGAGWGTAPFAPYASSPTPLLVEGRRRRDGAKGAYGPKSILKLKKCGAKCRVTSSISITYVKSGVF
ncbi:MAG: hypothetical protein RQ760_19805, partial [Sedimentisphaerales bacterium]|nr:hypothetical protein [Sedimentisphaerales bacterium]